MSGANMDDGALTINQFLEQYGISRSTAYEEIAAKRLRAVKVGRKTIIPCRYAREWLESLPPVELSRPEIVAA
jgi:excisionase family DNA binding protein